MIILYQVEKAYEAARELYGGLGVDVEAAVAACDALPLSIHCWQGDDCTGFENTGGTLGGGLAATGDYPGRARNAQELRDDLTFAFGLIPGAKKLNLHAMYLESGGAPVDRDAIEPRHFSAWADWAKEMRVGIDFNGTFFSHPKSAAGWTLASADDGVRAFWVEHLKRVRKIAAYFAQETGQPCVNNIWVPDGCKEVPIDTAAPRARLRASLDEALNIPQEGVIDAVESKLFGIGSESYVAGSHEFYLAYALSRGDLLVTFDTGHFHPTELVSAKLSAVLEFAKGLLLHVSRPVRWDSDHVVAFDDELIRVMNDLVRMDALGRVRLALDYFDASINRVAAWVIGARNTKKALLMALLQPVGKLKAIEAAGDTTARLAMTEELRTMPFGAVWDYYCLQSGMPVGLDWLDQVREYERGVLAAR